MELLSSLTFCQHVEIKFDLFSSYFRKDHISSVGSGHLHLQYVLSYLEVFYIH